MANPLNWLSIICLSADRPLGPDYCSFHDSLAAHLQGLPRQEWSRIIFQSKRHEANDSSVVLHTAEHHGCTSLRVVWRIMNGIRSDRLSTTQASSTVQPSMTKVDAC